MRERSCGAVVYARAADGVRYVLVHSRSGFWGFPKGHVEAGETERETAAREIWEETGLHARFVDGFRAEDEHRLAREGRPNVVKVVTYFLAECDDPDPHPRPGDREVREAAVMDYAAALAALRDNDALCRVLEQARRFLHDGPPAST